MTTETIAGWVVRRKPMKNEQLPVLTTVPVLPALDTWNARSHSAGFNNAQHYHLQAVSAALACPSDFGDVVETTAPLARERDQRCKGS